jgi:DMSO/TMAO reductase YedYZ molybdopterin-dependent catalytic subunit
MINIRMKCRFKIPKPLYKKGIGLIYECTEVDAEFEDISDLEELAKEVVNKLSEKLRFSVKDIVFIDNEDIGSNYILYRFRVWSNLISDLACSIRIVTYNDTVKMIISTINNKLLEKLPEDVVNSLVKEAKEKVSIQKINIKKQIKLPKGQRVIPRFIIYRILGQPKIDIDSWRLTITGFVENPLELSYKEILHFPLKKYKSDFHCVTGWTVRNVTWEGLPLRHLAEKAGVKKGVNWVYIESLDGYTTSVYYDDFIDEKALLVIKINGKELSLEQGYPARIFIPHLYGWKGAKWVSKITFLDKYRDGYWEALGYHERGNVWLEERFKSKN